MTTPYDPYATATSALPSATQNQIPGNVLGLNSTTVNVSELNFAANNGAVLGYSGQPGANNLYVAIVAQSGSDSFGNTYSTGLNALAGNLQGVSLIGTTMDATSVLSGTQINQATVLNPTVTGGTAAGLTHTILNSNGGVLGYTSLSTTVTYSTNGTYYWTCPTGITQIQAYGWGAGAGGGGGSSTQGGESGGAGEFAGEPTVAVSAGSVYTIIIGKGGVGGITGFAGNSGGSTSILTAAGTTILQANGGTAGNLGLGGAGGSGSNNTIHFDGGDGAGASGNSGGAGGGSSGGPTSEGNPGIASVTSSGGTGGAAVPSGGAGGQGGNNTGNGTAGTSPGGAGGGAGANVLTGGSFTYSSTSTYSYYGTNAKSPDKPQSLRNHDGYLYQGQSAVNSSPGYQYSLFQLPYTTIQANLAGKTVTSVSIFINLLHSYSNDQFFAEISYVSGGSFGNTLTYPPAGLTSVGSFAVSRPGIYTFNVGLAGGIGAALQSGACKAIFFGPGAIAPWQSYYGYIDSGANGGILPQVTAYYSEGGSVAGSGADGQVVLSYNTGTVPTYTLSVSGSGGTDPYGNTFPKGFTGPLLTLLNNFGAVATNGTAASLTSNTAGTPTNTNSQGFTGQMPSSQAIATTITNTTTGGMPITGSYTVPANDPQQSTVYRLTALGNGVFPSSADTPSWGLQIDGTLVGKLTLASTVLPTSSNYGWTMVGHFAITATGSGGNCYGGIGGQISQFGSNLSSSNSLGVMGQNANATLNTTVQHTVCIFNAGGPTHPGTVTCYYSTLERIGP
jgi:hypothetical protein